VIYARRTEVLGLVLGKGIAVRTSTFFITISIAIALGFFLSYRAYFVPQSFFGFNPYQALASLVFWTAAFFSLIRYPLKRAANAFYSYVGKSVFGFAIFAFYISVHLVVYGLILVGIVAALKPATNSLLAKISVLNKTQRENVIRYP